MTDHNLILTEVCLIPSYKNVLSTAMNWRVTILMTSCAAIPGEKKTEVKMKSVTISRYQNNDKAENQQFHPMANTRPNIARLCMRHKTTAPIETNCLENLKNPIPKKMSNYSKTWLKQVMGQHGGASRGHSRRTHVKWKWKIPPPQPTTRTLRTVK